VIKADQLRENEVIPVYQMATVFVNNPGNLSDPTRLGIVDSLVHDMESLPQSWGQTSTHYFVRDFLAFQQSIREEMGKFVFVDIFNF
jgi:hypothetical protein